MLGRLFQTVQIELVSMAETRVNTSIYVSKDSAQMGLPRDTCDVYAEIWQLSMRLC